MILKDLETADKQLKKDPDELEDHDHTSTMGTRFHFYRIIGSVQVCWP